MWPWQPSEAPFPGLQLPEPSYPPGQPTGSTSTHTTGMAAPRTGASGNPPPAASLHLTAASTRLPPSVMWEQVGTAGDTPEAQSLLHGAHATCPGFPEPSGGLWKRSHTQGLREPGLNCYRDQGVAFSE